MTEKIRILFLSANPWNTCRILVDEEAREIFEKLQEGPYRGRFEFYSHAAVRPADLQRLLMIYKPHIVHISAHGSKRHKLILSGTPGRGKEVDRKGLVDLLSLYGDQVRLVFLNACFMRTQAIAISDVIDYAVGTGKGIGDKGGVAFAASFYRALSFGKSVREAFRSARAEIRIRRTRRTAGFELFVRDGVNEDDQFPYRQSLIVDGNVGPNAHYIASRERDGARVPQRSQFGLRDENQPNASIETQDFANETLASLAPHSWLPRDFLSEAFSGMSDWSHRFGPKYSQRVAKVTIELQEFGFVVDAMLPAKKERTGRKMASPKTSARRRRKSIPS